MFLLTMTLAVFLGGVQINGGQLQGVHETKASCEAYAEQVVRATIDTKRDFGGDLIEITQICEAY